MGWFRSNFLPGTVGRRSPATPLVLRIDAFKGHMTDDFFAEAKANHVHVLVGTPNATQYQCVVDVACNSPFHAYHKAAKTTMKTHTNKAMDQCAMILCMAMSYGLGKPIHAWEQAYSPGNIRSGFRKTGIFPFNPDAYKGLGSDTRGRGEERQLTAMDMLVAAATDPRHAAEAAALKFLSEQKPRAPKLGPLKEDKYARVMTTDEAEARRAADAAAKAAEQAAAASVKAAKAAAAAEKKRKAAEGVAARERAKVAKRANAGIAASRPRAAPQPRGNASAAPDAAAANAALAGFCAALAAGRGPNDPGKASGAK